MKRNKAQQSVGMSFSTIFSIILIIAFVVFAFKAITFFLDFGKSSQIIQFYENFQDEIDNARTTASYENIYEFDLPSKITHVCFANFSAPLTGSQELGSQIEKYDYESNIFLIPQKGISMPMKKIEYLDIESITENQNPFCVENPGAITIIKELGSKKVLITGL